MGYCVSNEYVGILFFVVSLFFRLLLLLVVCLVVVVLDVVKLKLKDLVKIQYIHTCDTNLKGWSR